MTKEEIINQAFTEELEKDANWQKAVKQLYQQAKGVAGTSKEMAKGFVNKGKDLASKEWDIMTGKKVQRLEDSIKNTKGYKATESIPPKAKSLLDAAEKRQRNSIYGAGAAAGTGGAGLGYFVGRD